MTEVLGNKKNIEHLSEAAKRGRLSHAYIINGEKGSGKKTLAAFVAAGLLCNNMESDESTGQANLFAMMGQTAPAGRELKDGPCGTCSSCVKALSGNHPDIIWVRHEKKDLVAVKEVREQVIADIAIRPYYGPYKIYIIPDAHLMNENAQNAILKTIEEPPEYAIIFLLSDNADGLLDTIKSRCIRLDMERLSEKTIFEELSRRGFPANDGARKISSFAGGNLGKALSIAESAGESEFIESIKGLMKNAGRMDAVMIYDEATRIVKEDTGLAMEVMKMWFRDILILKAEAQSQATLFFPDEEKTLREQSRKTTFENISKIMDDIDRAQVRISANVKAEAALECLLLSVRRGLKG